MKISAEYLLSDEFAHINRLRINDKAITPEPVQQPSGGTVYLATADAEGNMVSFIQSNYMGFGSGIVIPGTGIGLQNRGSIFLLNRHMLMPYFRERNAIIQSFQAS